MTTQNRPLLSLNFALIHVLRNIFRYFNAARFIFRSHLSTHTPVQRPPQKEVEEQQ